MALTYGFYNSLSGDRKYNAIQMSSIFDGIIRDGVLMTIGDRFFIGAAGGMAITVGTGRAWFDHTWTYNDSIMPVSVKTADSLMDRIDALVLEVDTRDESRMNSIRWIYGSPASIDPQRPPLTKSDFINQYPLAYVSVARGTTNIQQANITNMIGTTELPYVTAPLEKIDATQLITQWNSQWTVLLAAMEAQKVDQKVYWEAQMNILHGQYEELLLLFHALETETFALINNNFDDWSVRRGCKITTQFLPSGDIKQTIIVIATNFTLAQKTTTFNADGSIFENIYFYPFEMVEGPRTIITTLFNITRLTTFNADGSITEVIGGSGVSPARLMDSDLNLLQDSDENQLKVWG